MPFFVPYIFLGDRLKMTRHNLLNMVLPRILITLCLLELITACSSNVHPTPSITPSTNPLSAQNPSLLQPNIGKARTLDLAGLLHIEVNPAFCSPTPISNAVVLASKRLEYDAGEIQQMTTFFSQIIGRGIQQLGNFLYDDPPAPPATLNVAAGGITGIDPTKNACNESMQITNIGNNTIHITGVNLRLLSDTQPNQYQYRLIDSCSLAPAGEKPDDLCFMLGGGGINYYYCFNLNSARKDAVFSSQCQSNQPLLDPGQVAFIVLYFQSPENLIYSVAPEITASLVDEHRTYTLSQLNSTLAFAKPDQLSCYKLHGNTFAQEDVSSTWGHCL